MISTLTSFFELIFFATSSSRSLLLAVKIRLYPFSAKFFAISKPIPDDAPVINAVSYTHLRAHET